MLGKTTIQAWIFQWKIDDDKLTKLDYDLLGFKRMWLYSFFSVFFLKGHKVECNVES